MSVHISWLVFSCLRYHARRESYEVFRNDVNLGEDDVYLQEKDDRHNQAECQAQLRRSMAISAYKTDARQPNKADLKKRNTKL